MQPHLAEISSYLADVRGRVASVIESTPAENFGHRPAGGGWTGTEIIQHLGKVEGSISKLLEQLFAKAMAAGMPMESKPQSWLHSLDHLNFLDRSRKIEAPERLAPDPTIDLGTSWASLQAARLRLYRAIEGVDGRDLTAVSAPHPIFGPLNGYQWFLSVGKHEERHLSQLQETLSEA
jgi:hypothetical protein